MVLDIITAPCALLATCLGVDTSSACRTPTKIRISKATAKKAASPPANTSETNAPPTVSETTVQDKLPRSDRTETRQPEKAADAKAVPIKQFTAPENQTSPQVAGSHVPEKSTVPASASESPKSKRQDDKSSSLKKQGAEPASTDHTKTTPALGAVGETPSKPKAPELSPPKVEQTSSEKPKKTEASVNKNQEVRQKPPTTNYYGHPCVPFYQPYPYCAPRRFFR